VNPWPARSRTIGTRLGMHAPPPRKCAIRCAMPVRPSAGPSMSSAKWPGPCSKERSSLPVGCSESIGTLMSGLRQNVDAIFRLLSRQGSLAEETAAALAACAGPMMRATRQITREAARLRKIAGKSGARRTGHTVVDVQEGPVQESAASTPSTDIESAIDAARSVQTLMSLN